MDRRLWLPMLETGADLVGKQAFGVAHFLVPFSAVLIWVTVTLLLLKYSIMPDLGWLDAHPQRRFTFQ
jgi:hypothetical protein